MSNMRDNATIQSGDAGLPLAGGRWTSSCAGAFGDPGSSSSRLPSQAVKGDFAALPWCAPMKDAASGRN